MPESLWLPRPGDHMAILNRHDKPINTWTVKDVQLKDGGLLVTLAPEEET